MTSTRRMTRVTLAAIAIAMLAGCKDKTDATQTTAASATVAPAPSKVDGLVFTKGKLKADQTTDETGSMKMTMSLTVVDPNGKPQSVSMEKSGTEKKSEKILATDGDVIQKLQVSFTEKTDTDKDPQGTETKKPNALNGKTFIIEEKDGKQAVTDGKGKALPPVETTVVGKTYAQRVGKPDPFMSAMPERPLVVGQPVPELTKAIEGLINEDGGDMQLSDVSVVFKEKSGDEGVFDVKAIVAKTDGPMNISIALTGDVHVRTADSQRTAMKLSGPVTISTAPDSKAKGKMDGKGTMEMTAQRMYH
jgi:hypothetical protein